MSEIKLWILLGVLSVGAVVLAFLARWFFFQVVSILKDIREELKNLTHVTTVQDLKLQNLEKNTDQNTARLDRHSNRIMDAEKRILVIEDKIK